jgi:hypothetical protein
MSGAVKSGLIFALVGIAAVAGLSFIPYVGALLCGPLAAALVGVGAGYYGVRWSPPTAGVGTGVLAGTIAGVGALLGSVLFWLVILAIARSMPEFDQMLDEALRQQPNTQLDPSTVDMVFNLLGPILGICFGIFNLVLALALGALGGWLAVRNRPQPGVMPTVATPLGPPPLDPPS